MTDGRPNPLKADSCTELINSRMGASSEASGPETLWEMASVPRESFHSRGSTAVCVKRMGHTWGTTGGDSLIVNRRQNKGLWCSAV
jgi:hypothetical protein